MVDKVVHLDSFRKPENLDEKAPVEDRAKFALDAVADEWANKLVHGLMVEFYSGGDVDTHDPTYHKLMEGLADITRSMTRHHLNVIDEVALLLQEHPSSEISVGVISPDEGYYG